ncbi:MAG: hypothetical protein ACJ0S4_02650 [Candidatus Rariloculaceae bacterium]
MSSFLKTKRYRHTVWITIGYMTVGLLIMMILFGFISKFVLNAPRPPFAGAEVAPDSFGPTLDQPPTPTAVRPAPTIPDEADNYYEE